MFPQRAYLQFINRNTFVGFHKVSVNLCLKIELIMKKKINEENLLFNEC